MAFPVMQSVTRRRIIKKHVCGPPVYETPQTAHVGEKMGLERGTRTVHIPALCFRIAYRYVSWLFRKYLKMSTDRSLNLHMVVVQQPPKWSTEGRAPEHAAECAVMDSRLSLG